MTFQAVFTAQQQLLLLYSSLEIQGSKCWMSAVHIILKDYRCCCCLQKESKKCIYKIKLKKNKHLCIWNHFTNTSFSDVSFGFLNLTYKLCSFSSGDEVDRLKNKQEFYKIDFRTVLGWNPTNQENTDQFISYIKAGSPLIAKVFAV